MSDEQESDAGRNRNVVKKPQLSPATLAGALQEASTVPKLYRPGFTRVMTGNAPPTAVMKAKCQSCVGFEEVITRVGDCTVRLCPIWPYRPYQRITEGDAE